MWRRGREVRQSSAKARTAVRVRSVPPCGIIFGMLYTSPFAVQCVACGNSHRGCGIFSFRPRRLATSIPVGLLARYQSALTLGRYGQTPAHEYHSHRRSRTIYRANKQAYCGEIRRVVARGAELYNTACIGRGVCQSQCSSRKSRFLACVRHILSMVS